ncbi:Arc family DNA-binding protein [Paraclostridium sordellii 8483]|nr:Arc family DNA-binding protein [Paeniclostridium sordellii]TAN64077.1 Arc family DNA-binding protein [Paeniclostridium sordellii 8483]
MSSDLPKFTLRIPKELLESLRVVAKEHGRSVNKEIEFIIKKYLEETNGN